MLELNKIYNTDCLEGMKLIPDGSIDLVVTDPPYKLENKPTKGKSGAFGITKRDYHKELLPLADGVDILILDELVRVMRKINIYIWCNKTQLKQYINYFEDLGATTELITWHKSNPVPTCNNKYLSDTEYLLFFREEGVRIYGSYHTKKKYYVTPTNKRDKGLYGHPTIKPLSIIENLIINSSQEGQVVLDPFIGSGTTAVAAVRNGRQYIGFEIDENYYNIAVERIANIDDIPDEEEPESEYSWLDELLG